jgi:hypothetical protein
VHMLPGLRPVWWSTQQRKECISLSERIP